MTYALPGASVEIARLLVLLLVFGAASYFDWKVREVRDELWIAGGLLGGAFLFLSSLGASLPLLGLYALVTVFVVQHFLPWDARLEGHDLVVILLELALYLAVIVATALAYLYLSPTPPADLAAVVVSVVLARALFETGLLYGGADAKALMTAGVLLPLAPAPLLVALPPTLQYPILQEIPFAFTMLVDGAVLTLGIPLVILAYNISRGEHRIPRAFHIFEIPTEELPHRFVWLKDPAPSERPREETTEEDEELRRTQAKELLAKGIDHVWVTPQLPFLIALAGGGLIAVLFGDLLLWLITSVG